MSDIIITGLVTGGIIGLPICLIVSMWQDTWRGKVLSFIICYSIFFGVGVLLGLDYANDCDTFNNGVCAQCGGEYRMSGATKTRMGSETFYYTCQDCGWTIETNCLMNKH